MNTNNYVITIGRRFGSGGRELGKLLATELGIEYYDKELLCEAAKVAGVSTEFIEKSDERLPSFLSGMMSFSPGYNPISCYAGTTPVSEENIYYTLSNVIKMVTERSSCVIVGRSADYILREHPRCLNIFVHAPIEACVQRIISRADMTAEQARHLAEKTNKLRANYYNFYTDKRWGDASSYDMTFDTSRLSMTDIVEMIKLHISRNFI